MVTFAWVCGLVSLALGYTWVMGYVKADLSKDLKPVETKRHVIGHGQWAVLPCEGPVYQILENAERCKNCSLHFRARYIAKYWPIEYLKRPFRDMMKAGEIAAKDKGTDK